MSGYYPDLSGYGPRISYETDGSVVLYQTPATPALNRALTLAERIALTDNDPSTVFQIAGDNSENQIIILFSQPVNISAIMLDSSGSFGYGGGDTHPWDISASTNTVNGSDGTWEYPTFPLGNISDMPAEPSELPNYNTDDAWRLHPFLVSFTTGPHTGLKFAFRFGAFPLLYIRTLHIYGTKSQGYVQEDINFLDVSPVVQVKTKVDDYGDVFYPNNYDGSLYIQNTSYSRLAKNVRVYAYDDKEVTTELLKLSKVSNYTPINTYPSGIIDSTLYTTSIPPASSESTAEQIGSISYSVTINRPATIRLDISVPTILDNATHNNGQNNTRHLSLYRNNDTLVDSSTITTYASFEDFATHIISKEDTIIETGIYDYTLKWWATQQTGEPLGNGIYLTNKKYSEPSPRDIVISGCELGQILHYDHIGPQEKQLIYTRLSPEAAFNPKSVKIKTVPEFFTDEGYCFGQTQGYVV